MYYRTSVLAIMVAISLAMSLTLAQTFDDPTSDESPVSSVTKGSPRSVTSEIREPSPPSGKPKSPVNASRSQSAGGSSIATGVPGSRGTGSRASTHADASATMINSVPPGVPIALPSSAVNSGSLSGSTGPTPGVGSSASVGLLPSVGTGVTNRPAPTVAPSEANHTEIGAGLLISVVLTIITYQFCL
ncbi:hypothetical protein K7432_017665 [Basidiobolus ranarum]|uniref:Uncharacterized protein n=1 Tax=Basidiobolus ranarum TaxID=34480 RepID=A0ABR2WD37_9FUNG